jgi:mono/diheme cytochrome c family protein
VKNGLRLSVIVSLVAGLCAFACETKPSRSTARDGANMNANAHAYKAVGVVTSVDAGAGRITIDHEDIPGYMPPMQMNEPVSDRALLNSVKTGDRVDFEIEVTGASIVVTKLTKIGEVAIADGGEIYRTHCAECHGANGDGTKKGIPLIRGHALHHSEAEYVEQVNNGEGKKMAAFKDKLTAEQIAAAVKFVRGEIQRDVRQDETHVHQH